jgi:hypothetical protein
MSAIRHKTFRFRMWDGPLGRPRLIWPTGPKPWGFREWLSAGIAMRSPSPYERLLDRVEAFVNEVGADNVVSINETNPGFGPLVTVWYRVEDAASRKPEKAFMAEL